MKPLAQSSPAERGQAWSVPRGDGDARGVEPQASSAGPLGSGPALGPERIRAQAAGAAEKFEAHFIKKMMEQMRASSRALSEQDGASHEHFNDDMLDVADGLVADALAHQHAFGIADLMLRSVLPPAAPSASASGDLSSAVAASPSPINTSSTAQESKR